MFGSSITRAARSACAPNSARAPLTAASYPLLWCTSSSHQRRLSSSKTSIPPNGATRGRSAAPTQQTAASSSGRVSRRKTKVAVVESRFARLPSVPSTEHLSDADINVSSFFSLHRPISVTTAYPPASTPASFASIFETRTASRRHRPSDVIQTLGSTVEALSPGSSQGDALAGEWQVLHEGHNAESRGPHMRASIPRDIPLSKFTSNLRPFSPPPVPEAFSVDRSEKKAGRTSKRSAAKPKSWTTTLIVTEFTTPDGETAHSLECTPFAQLPLGQKLPATMAEEPENTSQPPLQQPFLQRLRIRQIRMEEVRQEKGTMLAISVRRQRKLKMKKHKYKKLMKRTRNERRKLGKL